MAKSLLRLTYYASIVARMKTLYLLRHAKSSWDDPTLDDFDRPLNSRGLRASPLMGEFIRKHLALPELILCSSATRARMTLEQVTSAWPAAVPAELEHTLYLAAPQDILNRLSALSDSVDRVMVIGHNPALHRLAVKLTFGGDQEAMDGLRTHFPTAALAVLELGGESWQSLELTSGRLTHFVVPRALAKT